MGNKDDGIKKYVFSKTLVKTPANYTLVSDDVAKKINAIKKEEGKDIALWGGAGLLTSLLDLKLVDTSFYNTRIAWRGQANGGNSQKKSLAIADRNQNLFEWHPGCNL